MCLTSSDLRPGSADLIIRRPVLELLLFAVVPGADGPHIADDATVDLGLVAAVRAGEMLAADVAVVHADAERRGYGEVRQRGLGDPLDELLAGLAVDRLGQEGVEDR